MPVINVHSAATSGHSAPSFTASATAPADDNGPRPGRFDQLLASELGGAGVAPAGDDATAAVLSPDRARIADGARDVTPRSDARLGATSAPLPVAGKAPPPISAAMGVAGDAMVPHGGVDDATVATSAEPAPPVVALAAATSATVAPRTTLEPATISLGGGPVLGAAVADGLTLVADEVPAASSGDDATSVRSSKARVEGQETVSADIDDPAAEEAAAANPAGPTTAAPIPLIAATHAVRPGGTLPANTIVAMDKLVSTSLVAGAPAGARNMVDAAGSLDEIPGKAKSTEPGDRTPSTEMTANMPASAGAHRSGTSLPFTAIPVVASPAAGTATPLSAAVARSGVIGADAAASHHVERLYAPHDGAMPSGSASAFARLGTIGQDTGVALARGVADGRDHVALRLDPPDLGRIDVQLSFGQDGGLRAVVASDNRAALDLLRRDLDQLQRALADAGVRADAQSFHFSERQSGGGQRWDAPTARDASYAALAEPSAERASAAPTPRRLRSSGLIDVFA